MNPIARLDRRRVANESRSLLIPTHGIPTREHPQRAETVEARRRRSQTRVGRVAPAFERCQHTPVGPHQPGADLTEPPSRVEGVEQDPLGSIGTCPPREQRPHGLAEVVCELAGVTRPAGQASRHAREPGPRIERAHAGFGAMEPCC